MYDQNAMEYGTVECDGLEYALTGRDERICGTTYDSATKENSIELSCRAVDRDGMEYMVYWIFKGDVEAELDSYDYAIADHVTPIIECLQSQR